MEGDSVEKLGYRKMGPLPIYFNYNKCWDNWIRLSSPARERIVFAETSVTQNEAAHVQVLYPGANDAIEMSILRRMYPICFKTR